VNGTLAVVRVGDAELSLPHRGLPLGPVELAIRPESIQLSTVPATDAIAGTVTKAIYLGSRIEYLVGSPLGELFAIDGSVEAPIAAGSPVSIRLAEHGVTLIPR
jgi:iron(III) transport system ATP-binding protein